MHRCNFIGDFSIVILYRAYINGEHTTFGSAIPYSAFHHKKNKTLLYIDVPQLNVAGQTNVARHAYLREEILLFYRMYLEQRIKIYLGISTQASQYARLINASSQGRPFNSRV